MSGDTSDSPVQYCTIRPEFRDAGETYAVYLVVEDNGDRLRIQPVEWAHGAIVPIETVGRDMIDLVKLDDVGSRSVPDMPALPQKPAASGAKTRNR